MASADSQLLEKRSASDSEHKGLCVCADEYPGSYDWPWNIPTPTDSRSVSGGFCIRLLIVLITLFWFALGIWSAIGGWLLLYISIPAVICSAALLWKATWCSYWLFVWAQLTLCATLSGMLVATWVYLKTHRVDKGDDGDDNDNYYRALFHTIFALFQLFLGAPPAVALYRKYKHTTAAHSILWSAVLTVSMAVIIPYAVTMKDAAKD